MITINTLRNRIIVHGIKKITNSTTMSVSKKKGSLEGFNMIKDVNLEHPDNMWVLLEKTKKRTEKAFHEYRQNIISQDEYFRIKYVTVQIEYVYEILKYAWIQKNFSFDSFSGNASIDYNNFINNKKK